MSSAARQTIARMQEALIGFCHTQATLKEFIVLLANDWRRSPKSRAVYVVTLDRELVRLQQNGGLK